jgi:hypothetical protein
MKRIAIMLGTAAILYVISLPINTLDTIPRLIAKSLLVVSFPFVLYMFRFYEPVEIDRIHSGWDKWSNFGKLAENIKRLTKK